MSKVLVEVISGPEGPCLSVSNNGNGNGMRVAGPKPFGGGRITHAFRPSAKELREAVDFACGKDPEIARLSAALSVALAQLEEERARNAWRHISTAPANQEVLACNAAGYVGRAVLLKGKWEHIGMPTHWMPLPGLPTDTRKEL